MLLYLVQHGEAKREEEDPSRPLSDRGVEDVKKIASYAYRVKIEVDEILHSGKLRAKQTAEILAEHLKVAKGGSQTDGIAPLDDPGIWADRIKTRTKSLMLVGHLPHLARLSSLLVCSDMEKNAIAFKMGGIVCLRRDDMGKWSLQWVITPEIIV